MPVSKSAIHEAETYGYPVASDRESHLLDLSRDLDAAYRLYELVGDWPSEVEDEQLWVNHLPAEEEIERLIEELLKCVTVLRKVREAL